MVDYKKKGCGNMKNKKYYIIFSIVIIVIILIIAIAITNNKTTNVEETNDDNSENIQEPVGAEGNNTKPNTYLQNNNEGVSVDKIYNIQ